MIDCYFVCRPQSQRRQGEIIADIDLPLLEAVPELAPCEDLPVKKALRHKRLTAPARNAPYQLVIAQMALRALHCVFTADRSRLVRTVECNGYVDTINTATGKPAHWRLVGSISQRELNKGIIITTSDFTKATREEATRLGVELYNRERLLRLLRHHLHREFNIVDHERRKPPINIPPRPSPRKRKDTLPYSNYRMGGTQVGRVAVPHALFCRIARAR